MSKENMDKLDMREDGEVVSETECDPSDDEKADQQEKDVSPNKDDYASDGDSGELPESGGEEEGEMSENNENERYNASDEEDSGEVQEGEAAEEMSENERYASDDEQGDEQHEFEIIDQVDSDEEGGDEKSSDNGYRKRDGGDKDDESSDTDFDDSQLHEMLEKGVDKESIAVTSKTNGLEHPTTEGGPIIRNKIILDELDNDPFDILPEGWVCATHNSGMPIYLHKETRVVTMARPYYLGSASTRRHDIPISAIPCLQYKTLLNKAAEKGSDDVKPSIGEDGLPMPENAAKVVGASEVTVNGNSHHQPFQEIHDQHQPQTTTNSISTVDSTSSPPKVWMVAQDSSWKCPAHREPEELHTGKTNFGDEIAQVEPDSQLTTSASVNATTDNNPRSPGEENIAVKLHSSMPLSGKETGEEEICHNNDDFIKHLGCQEDDRGKDISITKDCGLDKISTSTVQVVNSVDNTSALDFFNDDLADGYWSPGPPPTALTTGAAVCGEHRGDNNGQSDSSHHNNMVVSMETSNDMDASSELVTSTTSTISTIKRKIDDIKGRRGGKHRRLVDDSGGQGGGGDLLMTTMLASSSNELNNVAVNTSGSLEPDEQLRLHASDVKIKSAEDRAKEAQLDIETVHRYCAQLFKFKTIVVKKYRTWKERRKHLGGRNRILRPELPSSTKLITCPIAINGNQPTGVAGIGNKKKEFVLNPSGKSFLCILHEYMQRTLRIQPTYVFKELENCQTPYGATVVINNIEYGTGYASSKKTAKQEAAKETLKILIPELTNKITDQELKHTVSDMTFFDDIQVQDPRVYELGNKVGQPSPFQLLRECLRRNFGMGATQCAVKTTALRNQKCEFSINVGKHSATVVARNKRDGKQLAAQAILAKLHPHVPSWGSLLRLYATNVEKLMEKVEEMNEIKTHIPNKAVLENLREEMRKLHRQKEAIQPKGKMVISTRDLPSKMSCVDL